MAFHCDPNSVIASSKAPTARPLSPPMVVSLCRVPMRVILVSHNLRVAWVYLPTISTSQALQDLYSLDISSPSLSRSLLFDSA